MPFLRVYRRILPTVSPS